MLWRSTRDRLQGNLVTLFMVRLFFKGLLPPGPSNSWADVLQSLGSMSLNHNSSFGDGNGVQGGGLGQQADGMNFGGSVDQGSFSLPDGLMDMLNGWFDWISLATLWVVRCSPQKTFVNM